MLLLLGARISTYCAIAARDEEGKLQFLAINRETTVQAVRNTARDVPGASVGPGLTSIDRKVGPGILEAPLKELVPIPGYALEDNRSADGRVGEEVAMLGFVAIVDMADLAKGVVQGSTELWSSSDNSALTAKMRAAVAATA